MSVDENPKDGGPATVSALERGIAVLRCFTETRRVLTPTELARLTGVPRPTVTRLASTLVTLGLMKQDPQTEAFMLGPGVVSLARVFLAGLDVRAVARPMMEELAEATGGAVYLAVRDGLEMVLIEACRPRSTMLAPRLDVGSRVPMGTSALGRAWLWAQPPAAREAMIESLRLALGADAQADEAGLRRALAEANKLGYAMSAGEYLREIHSVAVPLVGPSGEVMALNCGTAGFVFTEQRLRETVAPQLLEMAGLLAAEIGGHVPPAH
ncbi:IclR family transcriptional regulator [Ramlibacter sp. AW1]|uniref:IclR family transcriptional regulator n=1 Tax=Ramlibacter aurantiacus TaxID=2801330 RepID=A0A936ZQ61_9BURK|nr:IclR family transcriptional regulator [Ramlibacter aurantiacus]MBL0418965.1 IclR family transcriptional regulator [Ramlibacter aurantiacus]